MNNPRGMLVIFTKMEIHDDDYDYESFCLIIPSQVLQTTSMEMKTAFMPVWEPDKIFPYFYNHPNYVSANHLLLFCYNVDLFSTMTHLELVHDA